MARASCLRRVVSALPLHPVAVSNADGGLNHFAHTQSQPGALSKISAWQSIFFNPKYLFANFHTFGSCVVSSRTGSIKIS